MAMLILDPDTQRSIIARRRRLGIDQHDEVWNGVYVMSPLANDDHQDISAGLVSVFRLGAQLPRGTKVRPGVNISDRVDDWKRNFRCPDVCVFLPDTKAVCHNAFWHGGPDFAVEVRSRGDRTRKKLPFYASVGTRELLVVDRAPWRLQLYRLNNGTLESAGVATVENGQSLPSEGLPFTFALLAGEERPQITIRHTDGQIWTV